MFSDSERRASFGPRQSDPTQASAARVYDFLLDGTYSFGVDREAAALILREFPLVSYLARYNRRWVQRVVRYLVTAGVRQFLDIGSGIPTAGNVHEIAQNMAPETRVVYVDYEKAAINLGNDILAANPFAASIHADMRLPDTILDHATTRELLNFDEPIAVIWGSMLHFVEDRDDPHAIVGRYKSLLKPGDYLALSHLTEHFVSGRDLQQARNFVAKYNDRVAEVVTMRPLNQIERFFAGSELVEGGLLPLPQWCPDGSDEEEADQHDAAQGVLVGGVGRLL
jgi:hypothetical protein